MLLRDHNPLALANTGRLVDLYISSRFGMPLSQEGKVVGGTQRGIAELNGSGEQELTTTVGTYILF